MYVQNSGQRRASIVIPCVRRVGPLELRRQVFRGKCSGILLREQMLPSASAPPLRHAIALCCRRHLHVVCRMPGLSSVSGTVGGCPTSSWQEGLWKRSGVQQSASFPNPRRKQSSQSAHSGNGAGRRAGRAVRIAIEGNIASGKSTLLDLIRTEFQVYTGGPVTRE